MMFASGVVKVKQQNNLTFTRDYYTVVTDFSFCNNMLRRFFVIVINNGR